VLKPKGERKKSLKGEKKGDRDLVWVGEGEVRGVHDRKGEAGKEKKRGSGIPTRDGRKKI